MPVSVTAEVVSPREDPSTFNVAPSETPITDDANEPVTSSVPTETVVEPVYVFEPSKVKVPEPIFSSAPAVPPLFSNTDPIE